MVGMIDLSPKVCAGAGQLNSREETLFQQVEEVALPGCLPIKGQSEFAWIRFGQFPNEEIRQIRS